MHMARQMCCKKTTQNGYMLVMQISTKAQEGQKLGPNLGGFLHVISYYTTFNSVGPWATPRACK